MQNAEASVSFSQKLVTISVESLCAFRDTFSTAVIVKDRTTIKMVGKLRLGAREMEANLCFAFQQQYCYCFAICPNRVSTTIIQTD